MHSLGMDIGNTSSRMKPEEFPDRITARFSDRKIWAIHRLRHSVTYPGIFIF